MSDIGVVYIARGKDPNFPQRLERFVESWLRHPPGIDCQLYVIHKEYKYIETLHEAVKILDPLRPIHIMNYIPWNSYGGGCFLEACNHVNEPLLCTLVSTTEIMHGDWLKRLHHFFSSLDAGLVGCTGSHVANLHIRDTAILIEIERYAKIIKQFDFKDSKDGYLDFEHGPNNLTIQVMRANKPVFVVEKDRVIEPQEWPRPTTYQGNLHNVLVHDRGARDFNDL